MKCETCLSVLVARPAGRSSLLFRIQRTEKTGITTSWELKTASYAKNLYRCATTGEANALEMNNPLRSLRLSASGHFVTGAVFTQIAPILVLDRTLVAAVRYHLPVLPDSSIRRIEMDVVINLLTTDEVFTVQMFYLIFEVHLHAGACLTYSSDSGRLRVGIQSICRLFYERLRTSMLNFGTC
ncbi:hypothetical protein BDW71DRAFT_134871 [Aspergillus fruticulosus]